MHVNYRTDGSIQFEADTLEDRIILEKVHGVTQNYGSRIIFEYRGDGIFIADTAEANRPLNADIVTQIILLCREKKKLAAVKLAKDHTGLGLKEAKELVELWTDAPIAAHPVYDPERDPAYRTAQQ
jgi:hypothetical protein